MKKLVAVAVACTLLVVSSGIAFAVFVWPTRYRVEEVAISGRKYTVRFDRFSGEAEFLTNTGWTRAAPTTVPGLDPELARILNGR